MQAKTEWKRGHIWDILATSSPTALGLGISASPPPPLVSEFCLERYSSVLSSVTRLQWIKNPIICKPGSQLYLCPPPIFFQQYMKKVFFVFLRGLMASSGGGGGGHAPLSPPPPSIGSGTVGRRLNITAKIELICLTRPSIGSGSLFQHNKMNNTVLTKNVKSTQNSADSWKSHHWNLILRHVSTTKCYKKENGIQHW